MKKNYSIYGLFLALAIILAAASCANFQGEKAAAKLPGGGSYGVYDFKGGYPTEDTIRQAYDDADMARAIQAYKFFYPTVAFSAGYQVFYDLGIPLNKTGVIMEGSPKQLVFTPNSDTPYAFVPLDLSKGPAVIEIPPGPIMGAVNDLNEQWVMDYGLPGPDAGKGGKHLIIPPGYQGEIPRGYFTGTATTNRVVMLVRALPLEGDVNQAINLMKSLKIHSLGNDWNVDSWINVSDKDIDFTPGKIENNIKYWELLYKIINEEPPYEAYRTHYGDLAILGIVKGKPFAPDARMKNILERAAVIANQQMRVQSFADRRPDRIAWQDRKWEWATLRPENGTFDMPTYRDLDAREKWFYQAMVESPAMFRRAAGAGSLYWLGTRDKGGAYLDGAKTYKLNVPLPVPANLFWSVTVYDPETRSEIRTDQGKAALRSMVELKDAAGASVDLYFGPSAPAGKEKYWIKTIPGKGWFTYFRIYGPASPAFDGSWKPGDFEELK